MLYETRETNQRILCGSFFITHQYSKKKLFSLDSPQKDATNYKIQIYRVSGCLISLSPPRTGIPGIFLTSPLHESIINQSINQLFFTVNYGNGMQLFSLQESKCQVASFVPPISERPTLFYCYYLLPLLYNTQANEDINHLTSDHVHFQVLKHEDTLHNKQRRNGQKPGRKGGRMRWNNNHRKHITIGITATIGITTTIGVATTPGSTSPIGSTTTVGLTTTGGIATTNGNTPTMAFTPTIGNTTTSGIVTTNGMTTTAPVGWKGRTTTKTAPCFTGAK